MATTILDQLTWRDRQRTHQERVDGWLREHLNRRRGGGKHPVEDFLFTYYSHRPGQLRRWHPGTGVVLAGADPRDFGPDYRMTDAGLTVDAAGILARRGDSIRRIDRLLRSTAGRPIALSAATSTRSGSSLRRCGR